MRDATEGENRARITSSIITGLFITGDDYSDKGDENVKERARKYLTNPDVNMIATGRSFRPLGGATMTTRRMFSFARMKMGPLILLYSTTPTTT
ncbi:alpha-galactosidase [Prevotella dentalis DSM 3688]|uniref:Alpha-galactosidase n=1 Tax=Prevotella dentalis (strain ATCC 49559 / DSM 3688 / JCM 13448 / NCTC 12043 / ES 2772) TaxID=908937 RepID=F9D4M0_PREDD|nr:alpha-galactosidase [Prevotella dentalis DSM 3688]